MDVTDNSPELRVISDDMIEAFVLPKRASSLEGKIGSFSRQGLDAKQYGQQGDAGCDQQVDMVRHYHESVSIETAEFGGAVTNHFDDDARDMGIAKPNGTSARGVQGSFALLECRLVLKDGAFRGEAPVQAKCDESGVVEEMNMGESSTVEGHG